MRAFGNVNQGRLPGEATELMSFLDNPSPAALKSFLEKPKSDFTAVEMRKLLSGD